MSNDIMTLHVFSWLRPRLRALSGGVGSSSVASPPLSPALPKYKLADYRYGREEMLALYVKDNAVRMNFLSVSITLMHLVQFTYSGFNVSKLFSPFRFR